MKSKYGFIRFDNISEFRNWLKNKKVTRTIKTLQLHHTYQPSYANFYKSNGSHEDELTRQYNIKSFHVNTNGWSDIAQHFLICPNGKIVTGRDLNKTPIGIKGFNTNSVCIEIYGNFDKGKDVMTKEQKEAVIACYGELCKKFNITPSTNTIRCHAWFTAGGTYLGDYNAGRSAKTCPGTNFMGIGNTKSAITNSFIPKVKAYMAGTPVVNNITNTVGVYKVIVDELNIRQGPGTSYPVKGVVHKGEAYTITQLSGSWGHLKSNVGWININPKYCTKIR